MIDNPKFKNGRLKSKIYSNKFLIRFFSLTLIFIMVNHPILLRAQSFNLPVTQRQSEESLKIKQVKVLGSTVFKKSELDAALVLSVKKFL
jgi:hypothetical protein